MAAVLLLRRRRLLLAGGGCKREREEGGGAKDEDDDEATPFGRWLWLLWDWQGRQRRRRKRKRRRVIFGEEGASLFATNAVFILLLFIFHCVGTSGRTGHPRDDGFFCHSDTYYITYLVRTYQRRSIE
jgi:hypothetical protein